MNIADSIVTVINIRQITKCSSPFFCNTEFFVFSALDHSPGSRIILILQTNPILIHRFQWRNFDVLFLLENLYHQVVQICHEVLLRSLRIAQFRREEFPRDQVELFSKKFYQFVSICRISWSQFSTQKTKHDRHPILNNLLKKSFPWIAHGKNIHELFMVTMIGRFK